ncbi:MAG: aspartate carbamoyltransferase catalytic subunit [Candidatus Marinimicrobia bacterium]|nr:aspartate carbamoyltransferase catalytic subunit [Candidatus Neomarinimicrobiota bacterium]MBL7047489.1 aspartate carbamoyltransferase catalytic subunit [Candidatus Neomarinimicrobiota bacterium]
MMKNKHLLGLVDWNAEDIQTVIDTAFTFREILERPIKKVPTLQGKTVVNLFFEDSTRTRISFELAQKRLSADMINFSAGISSIKKGETFKDTAQNIEAMKIDGIVMRHPTPGAPLHLTKFVDAVVINAGDGTHEHPTQGLLDMTSLQEKFGKIQGLKIGIIGDITHSRVAKSNIIGLTKLGAEVTLCGPPTLMPVNVEKLGVTVNYNVDEVLLWANAVNILRIQRERQGVSYIPSIREYRANWGITRERLDRIGKEITIMHPGPMNRGVEIDSDVADSNNAIILNQVLNGVAVRMAILYLLLGDKPKEED